ncbi:unnamed protein product [Mytilus edulis]|uniref:Reverse transcriptase domain-containing protein n=1 Tax=Mytilus edulis TaxID=6550 RepID=A0A8S3S0S4_MYTED|nr:unnamed protein product [Mytilus edulis]
MKDNQQKVKEERMDTSESQLGGAVTQSQTPKENVERISEHIWRSHHHMHRFADVGFPHPDGENSDEEKEADDSQQVILALLWTHHEYFEPKSLSRAQAEYNFYRLLAKQWRRTVGNSWTINSWLMGTLHLQILETRIDHRNLERDCDGKVLFNEQLKCEELKKTYFKGNHLKTSSFDQTHYEEIMKKYKNISEEMFDQEMEEKEYNEPIDPDELIGAIQRLKNDTAPDLIKFFSELLMKADESLYSVLSYVFNKSWEEGKLPKPWKLANVKFIRKMGKSTYNNPSSYRPISLTSILGKVMERVVTSRLEGYIETNSILDPEQEGFRHYRSTENALLSLTQNIFNAFNNNEFILAVFIDLEKAYDSVWREGLLTKLYDNGVKGSWFETKIGLPQGSVIAPLLFNIFIKDIFANLSCKKCKFADDGTVWINGKNLNDMEKQVQKDLNIIQDWTKKWRINLSIEKTEYCIFSRNGPIKKMNLQLEGKLLKYNCNPKILGVTLDEKLSFLKHIENVEQKAHKAISLLRMIKGVAKISTKILLQIYQSIVLSTLEYASSVWQTCETNITDKLNKIQRKGLAICLNVTPTSSVETLEVVSGILPIHLRREEIATRTLAKINSYDISIPIKQILDDWKTIDIPEKYVSPVGKMILQAEDMKVCTGVDVNGIEAEFQFNGIQRYKSPPDYWKNLGNSKSRSTDQKNVGKHIIMEKLSHLPANSCIAFTDGSCLGSPGPVGAGAVIFPSNNQPQIEISKAVSKERINTTRRTDRH